MVMDPLYDKAGATGAAFVVEVARVPLGRFTEVTGLEVALETEEFREGGMNGQTHHLPTRLNWTNITLKRGITFENLLLSWFERCVGPDFASTGKAGDSAEVAISLLSSTGSRLRTWVLHDAYPVKWTGPTFAADNNDVATEQLEIAHSGFTSATNLFASLPTVAGLARSLRR
jgi:phage tail-like protein